MSHDHAHLSPSTATSRIRLVFVLNLGFAAIEVVGGLLVGSVAIVADAIHDLGDSASLGLALILQKYSEKGADRHFSYGYRRVSTVSALITGAVLLGGSVYIVVESIQRLGERQDPHGAAMFGLALFGLAVNGYAAWKLSIGATQNERMLTWHLLEDVLGWAAVLVGSVLILIFDWGWVDPVLAIGIALFMVWNVVRNFAETGRLLLQRVPANLDLAELEAELTALDGVLGVHDAHAWSLDGERHVFTCHVVIAQGASSHEIKSAVRDLVMQRGRFRVTVETERDPDPCLDQGDSPHS